LLELKSRLRVGEAISPILFLVLLILFPITKLTTEVFFSNASKI